MKRNKLVLSLAVLSVLLGTAHAKERKYRDKISGTAAPSSFESNNDIFNAHYVTFSGLSSLGPVHGAYLVEYDFAAAEANSPACGGATKIPIVASASTRATLLGDQLFLRDDLASALFCLNPQTFAFTMSFKGEFAGGMGRFEGATGTYRYKGSGQVLLADKIGMPFGGFVVKTEGKLILP